MLRSDKEIKEQKRKEIYSQYNWWYWLSQNKEFNDISVDLMQQDHIIVIKPNEW